MKKNKGFTLIELLAVIVVLAIIALIATPIVMNTIKSSKKGAAEQSGESYIKQVETSLMEYRIKTENTVPDGTYQINSEGNLEGEGLTEPLKIEMNGTKPSDGEIVIENGMVKRDASTMTIGDYTVAYNETSKSYVAVEKSSESEPESPYLCQAVTELSMQGVYESGTSDDIGALVEKQVGVLAGEDPYAYGVEYSCNLGDGVTRIFYVLEDGDTTTLTDGRTAQAGEVSLIASENIGTSAWCDDEELCKTDGDWDNTKGPITANNYLATLTQTWTKLNPSQLSLPSSYQIAQASGSTFNSTEGSFKVNLGWLTANLDIYNNHNDGGRYLTSSISTSEDATSYPHYTCNVFMPGIGDCGYTYMVAENGIRPVITISKTKLAN